MVRVSAGTDVENCFLGGMSAGGLEGPPRNGASEEERGDISRRDLWRQKPGPVSVQCVQGLELGVGSLERPRRPC